MVNFLIVSHRLRPGVELVDVALEHLAHGRRLGDLGVGLALHPVGGGPAGDRVGVEGHQGGDEVAVVAVDEDLAEA
jgi:hypothetical protein